MSGSATAFAARGSSTASQRGAPQCGQLGFSAISSQVELVASSVTSQTWRKDEAGRADKSSLRQARLGQK